MQTLGLTLRLWLSAAAFQATAQTTDPAVYWLEQAYAALRASDYDRAVSCFEKALDANPRALDARKDLAYTLLKIGETQAARDHLKAVLEQAPHDEHAALEYAFLCYETGERAEARRVFQRLQNSQQPEIREAAARAFQTIDSALAEGIARWIQAVAQQPGSFSAHLELARLAEQRDELVLARVHFEAAWRLRPERRDLLIDLARVAQRLGDSSFATTALVAAWAAPEPRVAERARELLGGRYPYVSEFRAAMELDPANSRLRRELAYLLLELGQEAEAEQEFAQLLEQDPSDYLAMAQLGFLRLKRGDRTSALPLLEKVASGPDAELAERVRKVLGTGRAINLSPNVGASASESGPAQEAKLMGIRSLHAGYLRDAEKYLRRAHELDPADFEVMLQLGYLYNVLKNDTEAIRWFNLARRSPDRRIAAEADRAYRNLRHQFTPWRISAWLMPFYSSRWHNLFGYGQLKVETSAGNLPFYPYVSLRFAGDAKQSIGGVRPVYLSESSLVAGVGIRSRFWHGLMAWAEVGSDISYLDRQDRPGRLAPDYRGGLNYGRSFGSTLASEGAGPFYQLGADLVFMSRFGNTWLAYAQNRAGYTLPLSQALGGWRGQLCWNLNLVADTKRQRWANFIETGPGLRFRWSWMPAALTFTVDWLRGSYTIGPGKSTFTDVRAGIWYAFSR